VLVLSALGERALGVQAAQLLAAARWMEKLSGQRGVRLETSGMRTQVIGLTAAALQAGVFREIVVRDGMPSLGRLLDGPVEARTAPELFCLDLYRQFDIDSLTKLAATRVISTTP